MASDSCIELILTIDDGYAEAFLVALLSIAATTDGDLRLNIISTQSESYQTRSLALIKRLGLTHRVMTSADVDRFFAQRPEPREQFTYDAHFYRLLAPDLFPDVQRAIYLDVDLIVRQSLQVLWDVDLAGNVIGAVADPSFLWPQFADFRAAYGGGHFNSGVMLWDLAAWRTERVGPNVGEWIAEFERQQNTSEIWWQFWDQSPLNRALQDRWLALSPLWNCSIRTNINQAELYGLNRDQMAAIFGDPAIYHFIGQEKPWKPEFATVNKYFVEYQRYSKIAKRLSATSDAGGAAERPAEGRSVPAKPLDFSHVADTLFEALSDKICPVSFVQVGAHDGVAGDPIHHMIRKFGWRGLLIEPVPYLFEQLQRNYRGVPGLIFENVCVSPQEGTERFYYMRQQDTPPVGWYSQLSSFRRDVILKHKNDIPDIEAYIEEAALEAKRLETLVAKHQLRVDALVVDTEGFDAQVISSLDLAKHYPFIVYFEYKHLPPDEAAYIIGRLKDLSYVVISDMLNVIGANPVLVSDLLLNELLASASAGSPRLL